MIDLSDVARLVREHLDVYLDPLRQRLQDVAARAVVQLVADGGGLQVLQLGVLDGEDLDDAVRFGEYGFFSVPLVGASAIVIFPNGDRDHPLVAAVDDERYRPKGGEPGDAGIYHYQGDEIRLKAGNITVIKTEDARLGGEAAVDGVIKGSSRNTAEQAFLTAMDVFVTAIVSTTGVDEASRTTFKAAIAAFKSAASAAVSTRVKTL